MKLIKVIVVFFLLIFVVVEYADAFEVSGNSASDDAQEAVLSDTLEAESDAPAGKIVRYQLKKDASGELVKDASGNFIFVPVYDDEVQEGSSGQRPISGQETSAYIRPTLQRQPGRYVASAVSPLRLYRHSLEIGPELYYFEYEEPGVMEDTGIFYGAVLGYTYRGWVPSSPDKAPPDSKGMIRAEGRCAFGRVEYDGALSGGTPYEIDHIDDYVAEGRLLFGAEAWDGQRLATFYTGIGYRYLNDDTAFDPAGYERESNYVYLPLGCQLSGCLRDGWSWGGTAEFDILLLGNQRSHLSDVGLFDVDNNQKKGVGCRGAIRIQHRHKNRLFVIEPFIRYWDIGKSQASSLGYEPANETIETGIQLIWGF